MRNLLAVLLIETALLTTTFAGEDFYKLLKVDKGSTTKEIRKAFKRLAVTLHPDKNQDNPQAHEEFLKITRAYEVLKDDDLRKKYDMHGEEGLKDDFRGGRQYESWKFYNEEFGLYDDDPEIITLSRHDFDISVEGTDDIWFINFYSPHCSHCHELAPTWREVARELEGVIRIGAINCGDDWQLCRMQGIRSYPSLLIYPLREKFYGERTTDVLVDYAMKHVSAHVYQLWKGNFESTISEQSELPWLITFCGDGGDCLSDLALSKLAVMLDGLVAIGSLVCHNNEKVCAGLGIDHGTYYFKESQVKKGSGLPISSLYPKDVVSVVLEQLPDVTVLDKAAFTETLARVHRGEDNAWLFHFVDGDTADLELRKLPAMLDDIHIGRVDCRTMRTVCNEHHVNKFPTFLVFKPAAGYEVYYGRLTAHDVAAFARDSVVTPMEALGPADFPLRVVDRKDPWFVDFFAPWCPPCMRLLPEFRKAAKSLGYTVNFGTVDCTVHTNLCRKYNVHSYPTTIFYNQSIPHHYHGHHEAVYLEEFLQDTLKPPVVSLDSASFDNLVRHRAPSDIWLIDYFAPWCGPCQQVAPEWRRLAKMLQDVGGVHVGQVDCQAHRSLCQAEGVRNYPSLWLYPTGSKPGTYYPYNGWHRDAQSLRAWAYEFLPSKVEVIHWQSFQQDVLNGKDAWIVDFYAPWCGHCQVFKPEFEKVAEELEGVAKAGKVDCDSQPDICQQAGIMAYPSVRFYPGNKGQRQQDAYGWDVESQNAREIIQFVKDNVPGKKQPHDEF